MLLHEHARELRAGVTTYRVVPGRPAVWSGLAERFVDPPGPMRLQDHITPEQADELADALRAMAAEVRALAAVPAAVASQRAGRRCA